MAANQEWHYSKNNQQFGPVSTAELKQLASNGDLSPNDLIWKEGLADWKVAGTMKGLFDSTPPPKSGPPPVRPMPNSSDERPSATMMDSARSAKKAEDIAVAQGSATSKPKGLSKLHWILGGVAMCLMLCCGLPVMLVGLIGTGVEHQAKQEEKQVQSETPIEVDASTLVSSYRDNTAAANEKYKDKIVQIAGIVKKIEERWVELESVHGFVGKNFDLLRVHVYLGNKEKSKMASLKQGQRITVKGRCSGKGFGDAINIENCVVID